MNNNSSIVEAMIEILGNAIALAIVCMACLALLWL